MVERGWSGSCVGLFRLIPCRTACSSQCDQKTDLMEETRQLMTHKYRGCIVVLSINKSVEPNEEQKVLISDFDQGFTVNTSKRVFRGIW
jgi:hypothetical protein